MNTPISENNYDDVFIRRVMVGLCSFLYSTLSIKQVKDDQVTRKKIPFFVAMTHGNGEQFMQDMYLDTDKYCNDLKPVEGNINVIPSGTFMIQSAGVSQQDLGSGYTRTIYSKKFDTEFTVEERDMSAFTNFLPIAFTGELKIKCGSEVERMKVFQEFMAKFYKVKKYWIRYNGFPKLPCMISFSENGEMEKNFTFQYPDGGNNRPILTVSFELTAWMPVIDPSTERFHEERIKKDGFTHNIEAKNVECQPNPFEKPDPNAEHKLG